MLLRKTTGIEANVTLAKEKKNGYERDHRCCNDRDTCDGGFVYELYHFLFF